MRLIQTRKLLLAVAAIACISAFVSSRSSAGMPVPADVAAIYKAKCASCHGADGSGQTAVGKKMMLKDLRSAEVQGLSDDQLYAIVAKGKGKMPGYEKSLKAATCKELVAYIRQLKP